MKHYVQEEWEKAILHHFQAQGAKRLRPLTAQQLKSLQPSAAA